VPGKGFDDRALLVRQVRDQRVGEQIDRVLKFRDVARLVDEADQRAVHTLDHVMKVPAALDAQLLRDAKLTLFEYFVLSALSMADRRTLTMSQLAAIVNGSLSRLSNVVKQLERRGWVRREPHPENRRYTHAVLTDAGWEKVVAAAPGHVEAVRRLVFDPLTNAQIAALGEIGQRVVHRVDPDSQWP
jgi:DNA-binding MarR family transcriptional regulator